MSAAERWNEAYVDGVPPWDVPDPDAMLIRAVEAGDLPPGRLIEIGCGTGTNARYLDSRGFEVVGVDFAPLAIEKARKRSPEGTFQVHDVLAGPLPGGNYDAAFDRGCFHVFAGANERRTFVEHVASALRPGGLWLSLIGSTEGGPRDGGPPRRSARDIVGAIEPHLEVLALVSHAFDTVEGGPVAWSCLARKRRVPAAPSTPGRH